MFVIMVLLVCATCFVVLDLSFCMRLVIGAKTKLTCRFFCIFLSQVLLLWDFL